MNLRKINKLFFLFFLIILSCTPNDDVVIENNLKDSHIFDDVETLSNINIEFIDYNPKIIDYYSLDSNFKIKKDIPFIKLIDINRSSYKKNNSKPLNIFIIDNHLYYFNDNSEFEIYELENGKKISSNLLDYVSNNKFSMPTSIAMINDLFYVSYSDGIILCFDKELNIVWKKLFNDILRTPLKIQNNNLIILLSNSIASLNSNTGFINWKYDYDNIKTISIDGGVIVSNKNFIYFILPNKEFGQIETIIGEKVNSIFVNLVTDNNNFNQNYTIHSFDNYISIIENNNTLSTIDLKLDNYLYKNYRFIDSLSSYFYNNSLFIVNKSYDLKAVNLINKKIFWNINISDYLSKNDKLIKVDNNNNNLLFYFSNGKIIEINRDNGNIMYVHDIKIDKIYSINKYNEYIIVNRLNGKTIILKQ